MSKSAAISLFIIGCLLLFATEILRVYFIMPFPGSQQRDTVGLAWTIDHYRFFLRTFGLALIARPLFQFWRRGRIATKIGLSVLILLYAGIFYLFNFRFEADKMFYQPSTVRFADSAKNKIPLNKLVIGTVIDGQAKAYPIQLIGYHHQVRDTIGRTPVMITYCTVCRTGRVFSPTVGGRLEDFRLVGMDHFNAMFEDATTGSWWQQATGIAVAGPLRNTRLAELPSSQLSLAEWLALHPDSRILQADTLYKKQYDDLADYDNGTIKGSLEHRDSASWKPKSWVVGVRYGDKTKAYDWDQLVSHPLIQDTIGSEPILLLLGDDSTFYHVWGRRVQGQTLFFKPITVQPPIFQKALSRPPFLLDTNTHSLWNFEGRCFDGPLKGQQLPDIQSYQEFWHSWRHFHPATAQYKL